MRVPTSILPGHRHFRRGQDGAGWLFFGVVWFLLVAAGVTPWVHSMPGLVSYLLAIVAVEAASIGYARHAPSEETPVAPRRRWLLALPLLVLLLAVVVRPVRRAVLGVEVYRIPAGSHSSVPTIRPGERLVAAMRPFTPRKGDLVLFHPPDDAARTYVKRIVAVGGERYGETDVPIGSVFVAGDNPANSRDSRHFGPVPIDAIIGRPLFVLWSGSWKRIGTGLR